MKTRKIKLGAIMLSSARGLAFIGSIGGTIAWYQYSTLATAAVSGSSAKCTENLQVAVGTGEGLTFKSSLTTNDISNYLKNTRAEADQATVTVLKPVTAGNQERNAELNSLKSNPVYQHGPYTDWEDAVNTDYVTFPLTFRVLDIDGKIATLFLTEILSLVLVTSLLKEKTLLETKQKEKRIFLLLFVFTSPLRMVLPM